MSKFPITPLGLQLLKKELDDLKSQRPVVANEIEVARGHGDLSENADYHAAKEKSGLLEAKIRDAESKVSTANVIDPDKIKDPQKVVFGVSVKIEDIDTGEAKQITILGNYESDTKKNIISIDTPLARALIGKEASEFVEVKLPGGTKEYEVLEISGISTEKILGV